MAAQMDEADRLEKEREINAHDQQLQKKRVQLEDAEKEVENRNPPDMKTWPNGPSRQALGEPRPKKTGVD